MDAWMDERLYYIFLLNALQWAVHKCSSDLLVSNNLVLNPDKPDYSCNSEFTPSKAFLSPKYIFFWQHLALSRPGI